MAAAFSNLPNELITQIWSHVLEPKDVERFAPVSKNILALAPRFINEHQRLKDRFSFLYFEHENNRHGSPPARFLAGILRNPRAALYVDQVCIEGWKTEWDHLANVSLNMATDHHLPYPQETMQLFEEAVTTSAFIPESEAAKWISEIRKGDERTIFALMITLLSNVRSFGVDGVAAGGHRLAEMIRQIGISPNTTALSQLTKVGIGWSDPGLIHNDFNWVMHFSSLKSVKSIEGSLVGQLIIGMEYWFSLPPKWSNITSLHLDNCSINDKQLFLYLQCLAALETFTYRAAHQAKRYDPFWLCTALVTHAGHSLKTLQILSKDGRGSHMGSLAGLNLLTELCTEYRLLLDYVTKVDDERLVEMLPPSIEEVELVHNDHYDLGVLQRLVLKMCELKAERLPNLKVLMFLVDEKKVVGMPILTLKEDDDNSKIFELLKKKSMEVGVELHIEYGDYLIPL